MRIKDYYMFWVLYWILKKIVEEIFKDIIMIINRMNMKVS